MSTGTMIYHCEWQGAGWYAPRAIQNHITEYFCGDDRSTEPDTYAANLGTPSWYDEQPADRLGANIICEEGETEESCHYWWVCTSPERGNWVHGTVFEIAPDQPDGYGNTPYPFRELGARCLPMGPWGSPNEASQYA